jgi:TetR/AcrR family transcriptional regulator
MGKRESLIQAGIELLSEKTFSEISMDHVAERSGVSKPMIYYYFDNKEGFYRALAEQMLLRARSLMSEVYDSRASLRENLIKYVRFRLMYVKERPDETSAFLSIITDPNIGVLISELQSEFDVMRLEFIDPMFDRAIQQGEIRESVNRSVVMMMLNSLLITYTVKFLNNLCCLEDIDPNEIVGIVFDGISANGEDN